MDTALHVSRRRCTGEAQEEGYCVKRTAAEHGDDDEVLNDEDASLYRTVVGKAMYASLDRSDTICAVRSGARRMKVPTVEDMIQLKRLDR